MYGKVIHVGINSIRCYLYVEFVLQLFFYFCFMNLIIMNSV